MRGQGRQLVVLLLAVVPLCGCKHPLGAVRGSVPVQGSPEQVLSSAGPSPVAAVPSAPQVVAGPSFWPEETSGEPRTAGQESAAGPQVQLVEYTQHPAAASPPDSEQAASEEIPVPGPHAADGTLTLPQVVASVRATYPLLEVAIREQQVAAGKETAAWGEFDLQVKSYGITEPLGFYNPHRALVLLDQPLYSGGSLFGGYRVGRGPFQPWYKERETDDGGEFALGVSVPLLKDRAIDQRRSEVTQTALARAAVDPAVRSQLLDYVRLASQIYWEWVAAGRSLEAQRSLLRLAQLRVSQIDERVRSGDLERIVQLNNGQLIAARETKLIETQRKLQASAIKLSLFYRDSLGQPVLPDPAQLPADFPEHTRPDPRQIDQDIATAIGARPEFVELDLLSQRVSVELAYAENLLLPKLEALVDASQDVGGKASSIGDKSPFELEAGLFGELPLQRREAWGKIEAARGKLAQIRAKQEYVANKVTAEVQDAISALTAAADRIERARTNVDLALKTQALGELAFDAGDIDLIALNIYEQAVTDAQLLLIAAEADFFIAQADYRAALAEDPLRD